MDSATAIYWWEHKDPKKAAEAVVTTANKLREDGRGRLDRMKEASRAYREKTITEFKPGGWHGTAELGSALTYNVVRSCTDTVVAKLGLHQPSAQFSTFGAEEDLQERARGLTKLNDGVIQLQKGHHLQRLALRDCCLYPIGLVKCWDEKTVHLKRLHPSKLFVDDFSMDVDPISYFEVDCEWTRGALLRRWPSKKKEIGEASAKGISSGRGVVVAETIEVFEAFQIGFEGRPGRHMIVLDGGIPIVDEEWQDPESPYEVIRFGDDVVGFDGLSLWEQLRGIQDEINFVLEKVQANMEVLAEPYYLVHKSSQIVDEHLQSNERFRKVEWAGQVPPKIEYPPGVNPQVFQYLEQLYQRAFEIAGVSQLSATSRKPADLESGVALRTFLDVETVRFSPVSRALEQMAVGLGRKIVRAARRCAKRNKDWVVNYVDKKDRLLQKIRWEDVSLEENQFTVQVWPVSAFPQHPAARLERAAELARDQLIDRPTFLALAEMPDLEKVNRLLTAPYEDLERLFEWMLSSKGEDVEPEEFQDLEMGVKLGRQYWARAKIDGVPEERINRLAVWLQKARDLVMGQMGPPAEAVAAAAPELGAQSAGLAPQTTLAPPVGPADVAALEQSTAQL